MSRQLRRVDVWGDFIIGNRDQNKHKKQLRGNRDNPEIKKIFKKWKLISLEEIRYCIHETSIVYYMKGTFRKQELLEIKNKVK